MFPSAQFGKSNPTGNKAGNKITKNVFGKSQGAKPGGKQPTPGKGAKKQPTPKGKSGKTRYDTATNSFTSC